MWLISRAFLALLCVASISVAQAQTAAGSKALTVYFIDVEGGQSTLFVTPAGQSLLIDTGWPDEGGRDADRIVGAAKLAGLTKIDFVLLTHYHADHAGGVAQLLERIPVGTFIDHGPNRETSDAKTEEIYKTYQVQIAAHGNKHMIAKPGDVLPIEGMRVEVLTADGASIDKPLPGAGAANPACATSEMPPADPSENARSLGVLITFDKTRILDLGDLTAAKERDLVCPVNKIAAVDVFVVSHHGTESSSSPALLAAISPRLAIMDNGATKGGSAAVWDRVKASPRLQDLWQLHLAEKGGPAHNSADPLLANPAGPDAGNYLKLSVWPDGRLEVFNPRTKASKNYAASTQ
jgi:competence protein ComEC